MSSSLPIYIPRETIENEFSPFLKHEKKFIWSIHGVGGIGKSTLINRFYQQTKNIKQSSCLLDYPNHTLGKISGLDILLHNLLTNKCNNFDKIKKVIEKKYTSVAQKLGNISTVSEHIPVNSITALIAELDQDEDYTKELGIVWKTVTDTIKLSSKIFSREKKDEIISTNPELHLLTALLADFKKNKLGIVFIDTYEKLKDIRVTTTLQIIGDEVIARQEDYELSFEEYITIVFKFLTNKIENATFKIVVAGRSRLNKFAGESLFRIKQNEVNKFEPEQIINYFEQVNDYIENFPLPNEEIIEEIHEITKGNPLILEFLIQFIMVRYEEGWSWGEWYSMQEEFTKSDDEFGLIYYLTDRIATHISGWENSLWKLMIPLELNEEVAQILYPKSNEGEVYGKAYFRLLQQKGILRKGKGIDGNTFYTLDEVKFSLEAFIAKSFTKNGKHWTNHELVLQANQDLSNLYKNHRDDPVIKSRYIYHQLQTIVDFEEKSDGMIIKEFTYLLMSSLMVSIDDKELIGNNLSNYKKEKILNIISFLNAMSNYVLSFASEEFIKYASKLAIQGKLPIDFEKNEGFLKKSLIIFPSEPFVLGSYANVLKNIRKDYDTAEEYYKKAIAINETNDANLGNYALFLDDIRKDYDSAEVYYRKAIAANEKEDTNLGNYALFLKNIRKHYDASEMYYEKAINANETNDINLGNYALFLYDIRKDYDAAEVYFKKAIASNENNDRHLGNYALFLENIRKDYDAAKIYYEKAIAVNKTNDEHLGNYALFLKNIRKNYDAAEAYYKKAIAANENNDRHLGNYALFLENIRKDYDAAKIYYEKAIAVNETNDKHLGNYANFLRNFEKDYNAAEAYYKKAIAVNETNERHLGNYALFLEDIRKDYDTAELYYKKAIVVNENDDRHLYNYALFLEDIRKDYDTAELYYKKAIVANENDDRHLYSYAFFLDDIRKDYDAAEVYYIKAIQVNSENKNSLMNLGFLYFQKQKLELAKKYLLESIKFGSLDLGNMNLGNVFFVEKKYKEAIEKYKLAINNFGNSNEFLEGLDDDFQYLEQYGVTKEEFEEMKAELKVYAESL